MMPQSIFMYEIPGFTPTYVDPVHIRRSLLQETDAMFWEYVKNAHDCQKALVELGKVPTPTDDPEGLERLKATIRVTQLELARNEDNILAAAYRVFGWTMPDPTTGLGVKNADAMRVIVEFLEYAEKKE